MHVEASPWAAGSVEGDEVFLAEADVTGGGVGGASDDDVVDDA